MKSKSLKYIASNSLPNEDLFNKAIQYFNKLEIAINESKGEVLKELKLVYNKFDAALLAALKKCKSCKKELAKEIPWKDKDGLFRVDDEALDALEDYTERMPSTKSIHTDDNRNYTNSRLKLHDQIIADEEAESQCIRQEKPIAILTAGAPGSGKGYWLSKNTNWDDNPIIFNINADDIRAKLPEYTGYNAGATHSEATDIVKKMINRIGAMGCSYDTLYDGTMSSPEKYITLIDLLKKNGYEIYIIFMKVDKETSLKRMKQRFIEKGRYVPRFVIDRFFESGNTTFDKLKSQVTGYIQVDGVNHDVLEKGGKDLPVERNYGSLTMSKSDNQNDELKSVNESISQLETLLSLIEGDDLSDEDKKEKVMVEQSIDQLQTLKSVM